jgi:hypothetical protein
LRVELAGKIGEDAVEDFRLLILEDDTLGKETVTEVVTRRVTEAGGRDRSAGFGAVGAGGVNAALTTHATTLLTPGFGDFAGLRYKCFGINERFLKTLVIEKDLISCAARFTLGRHGSLMPRN